MCIYKNNKYNFTSTFKFKLYPQNKYIKIKEGDYIETNLYYKGNYLILNENNEIIYELVGREFNFATVKKDKEGILTFECELFKKIN